MDETVHRQVLDSVPDGVFTVDFDWRITSFNAAAESITGISRRQALGQHCCEVFRASICESACALRQTLATQRPVSNKVVDIVNPAGERIPISISTAPLRDDRGRVIAGSRASATCGWSRSCAVRWSGRIRSPTSSAAVRRCGSCSTSCRPWRVATARCFW